MARRQLVEHGLTRSAIRHRLATGQLHPVYVGVYAVGRPELSRHGRWMAAVLACGDEAVLSHSSAAALWGFAGERRDAIEVSVPLSIRVRQRGVLAHRRKQLASRETTRHWGIPVTRPACTLIDLATDLRGDDLEAAVNAADISGRIRVDRLRVEVARQPGRPGAGALGALIDRRTFRMTRSKLERRFFPIVRAVGLQLPETGAEVNGFEVDFYWPDLGLVVETDGLTYHRTPAQQATDRVRDQTHTAAGLTVLRFTHAQIAYERAYVEATLRAVVERLVDRGGHGDSDRPIVGNRRGGRNITRR